VSFGFPAYHTEHRPPLPGEPSQVYARVEQAMAWLGWTVNQRGAGYLAASTKVSLASWGERVEVHFAPDGSLTVTSKCSLPTQCFDWGRNRGNVQRLLAAIG
jgi:hypothetical protein